VPEPDISIHFLLHSLKALNQVPKKLIQRLGDERFRHLGNEPFRSPVRQIFSSNIIGLVKLFDFRPKPECTLNLTNILELTPGFIVLAGLQYATLRLSGKPFNLLPNPGLRAIARTATQDERDGASVLINQKRGSKPKDGLNLHNALAFAGAFAVL
jgi:hypothetical protein